jgi:hypothetical protein
MVRQLATGYVVEHVEHAYCMTAHGMQGGSVEHATVRRRARRSPRAPVQTALSRAGRQRACTSTCRPPRLTRGSTRRHRARRDPPQWHRVAPPAGAH